MDVSSGPVTAAQWASTVSTAHYKKHRDELDSLVTKSVPGYHEKVTEILAGFVRNLRDDQARYDAEHDVVRLMRPLRPTLLTSALWWISILGGTFAFAVMLARGGPSVSYDTIAPDLRALLASLAFAAGVTAQLIRALPLRRSVPPRRDIAWVSTTLGAVALVIMIRLATTDGSISPLWIGITGVALTASAAYGVHYVRVRRRDRELTSLVDSIEEDRLDASADRLEQFADKCGDALEEAFKALPPSDQAILKSELSDATRILRDRGIIGAARYIRLRAVRTRRPMIPGSLLLEKLVQETWNPSYSEPRTRRRVNWLVTEYLPKRRQAQR